jgi:hypothetical protein
MTPASPPPYRVSCPEALRQQLRTWGERAIHLGIGQQYLEALRFVWRRMSTDPLVWGDPVFNLHNLDLLVLRGANPMLYVQYAVHQVERVVFVTSLHLPATSPLNQAQGNEGTE